ncbi:GNAT family N-acetyltransferase [Streptomyces boncukensis]|uniref:GNAT family N-acetyltransferase n=1 Tax=Streptomyces boncukensis TaxID=2711219 RepID=A0A6G4X184_9ACTN|nr:GNAT family N-acetyltransferase [Streptomyces boncukensis]NGO71013.1 GNAT family N-acetyltransferase [Streptomyces boncukensis]
MQDVEIRSRDAASLHEIRPQLLAVYAEIYADRLHEEFHSVERFDERLGWNTEVPGFAAAVGYHDTVPVGYAFGCVLQPGTNWWKGLRTPVSESETTETGSRTFALSELMVLETVRGTGVARQIHDALLRGRTEERVTLLVERDHPRVRAHYEDWGYQRLGEVLPFPDAPVYDAMVLRRTGR